MPVNYSLNVPAYVLEYKLPKVFLQPMVENAIVHGLEKQIEPGNLLISIWVDEALMRIEVSDDGCGIEPEELNRLRGQLENISIPAKEKGIGLHNLKSRLRLYYGTKADLQIETELGIGTSIILLLPAERK